MSPFEESPEGQTHFDTKAEELARKSTKESIEETCSCKSGSAKFCDVCMKKYNSKEFIFVNTGGELKSVEAGIKGVAGENAGLAQDIEMFAGPSTKESILEARDILKSADWQSHPFIQKNWNEDFIDFMNDFIKKYGEEKYQEGFGDGRIVGAANYKKELIEKIEDMPIETVGNSAKTAHQIIQLIK